MIKFFLFVGMWCVLAFAVLLTFFHIAFWYDEQQTNHIWIHLIGTGNYMTELVTRRNKQLRKKNKKMLHQELLLPNRTALNIPGERWGQNMTIQTVNTLFKNNEHDEYIFFQIYTQNINFHIWDCIKGSLDLYEGSFWLTYYMFANNELRLLVCKVENDGKNTPISAFWHISVYTLWETDCECFVATCSNCMFFFPLRIPTKISNTQMLKAIHEKKEIIKKIKQFTKKYNILIPDATKNRRRYIIPFFNFPEMNIRNDKDLYRGLMSFATNPIDHQYMEEAINIEKVTVIRDKGSCLFRISLLIATYHDIDDDKCTRKQECAVGSTFSIHSTNMPGWLYFNFKNIVGSDIVSLFWNAKQQLKEKQIDFLIQANPWPLLLKFNMRLEENKWIENSGDWYIVSLCGIIRSDDESDIDTMDIERHPVYRWVNLCFRNADNAIRFANQVFACHSVSWQDRIYPEVLKSVELEQSFFNKLQTMQTMNIIEKQNKCDLDVAAHRELLTLVKIKDAIPIDRFPQLRHIPYIILRGKFLNNKVEKEFIDWCQSGENQLRPTNMEKQGTYDRMVSKKVKFIKDRQLMYASTTAENFFQNSLPHDLFDHQETKSKEQEIVYLFQTLHDALHRESELSTDSIAQRTDPYSLIVNEMECIINKTNIKQKFDVLYPTAQNSEQWFITDYDTITKIHRQIEVPPLFGEWMNGAYEIETDARDRVFQQAIDYPDNVLRMAAKDTFLAKIMFRSILLVDYLTNIIEMGDGAAKTFAQARSNVGNACSADQIKRENETFLSKLKRNTNASLANIFNNNTRKCGFLIIEIKNQTKKFFCEHKTIPRREDYLRANTSDDTALLVKYLLDTDTYNNFHIYLVGACAVLKCVHPPGEYTNCRLGSLFNKKTINIRIIALPQYPSDVIVREKAVVTTLKNVRKVIRSVIDDFWEKMIGFHQNFHSFTDRNIKNVLLYQWTKAPKLPKDQYFDRYQKTISLHDLEKTDTATLIFQKFFVAGRWLEEIHPELTTGGRQTIVICFFQQDRNITPHVADTISRYQNVSPSVIIPGLVAMMKDNNNRNSLYNNRRLIFTNPTEDEAFQNIDGAHFSKILLGSLHRFVKQKNNEERTSVIVDRKLKQVYHSLDVGYSTSHINILVLMLYTLTQHKKAFQYNQDIGNQYRSFFHHANFSTWHLTTTWDPVPLLYSLQKWMIDFPREDGKLSNNDYITNALFKLLPDDMVVAVIYLVLHSKKVYQQRSDKNRISEFIKQLDAVFYSLEEILQGCCPSLRNFTFLSRKHLYNDFKKNDWIWIATQDTAHGDFTKYARRHRFCRHTVFKKEISTFTNWRLRNTNKGIKIIALIDSVINDFAEMFRINPKITK